MKKSFLMYAGALFCLVVFLSVSCENFLDGAGLKGRVDDQIEYANASPQKIRVECDSNFGLITSGTNLDKKVSDTFNVEFKAASSAYFAGWSAFSKSEDGTLIPLPGEYLKFEEYNTDAADGSYGATVTLLKKADNVIIRPVAFTVSPSASEGVYANVPLVLNFSIPAGEESVLNSQAISVQCGMNSLKEYFYEPAFNSTRTLLTLAPDSLKLKAFISEEVKASSADVQVTFGERARIKNSAASFSLDGKRFTVTYLAETENTPPVVHDFFVTRHEISLESAKDLPDEKKFNMENISVYSSGDKEKFIQNMSSGKIWIYGEVSDDSGDIKSINIRERLVNDAISGTKVHADLTGFDYYSVKLDETKLKKDENGHIFFCLERELLSGDGVISVQAEIEDYASNKVTKNFTVTKKSQIKIGSVEDLYVYNYRVDIDSPPGSALFDENEFEECLRSINVQGFQKYLYPVVFDDNDTFFEDKDNFTLTFEYTDSSGQTKSCSPVFRSGGWQVNLSDVEKVSGLSYKIIAEDGLGNRDEKTFTIPESENIRYYLEGDDSSRKTVRFQPVSQDYGITNGLLVYDSTEWWEGETVTVVSENNEIEADTVYKVIPQFNTDQGSFYVEIPEDLEIFYDSNASAPPEISHKSIMCGIKKADELIYDENYYDEDRYLPALKLTLTLKEGIYDDYDLVWAELDDFTKKSFDRENLSVSFLVETESLFADDVVFTVYGIKNGVRNSGTDITFPAVTGDITYDNMPPRAYLDEDVKTDWEHIALRTGDLGSGSEKGIFNIQFIADESNSYSVVLPLRNIVVEQGLDNYGNMVTQHNFYVDYVITDKAGNCTTGTLKHDIGYIPKVERIIKSDSTGWKLLSEEYESGEGGDTNRYQVYTIDENNVWTPYDLDYNRFTVDVYTSGTGLLYYQSQYAVTLPQNSFIKLQVSIYDGRPSVPSFFYTGTQNTGKYDYIQPLSKKAFLIASDAPVYVQTFITTKPYSQCKDWGIREWEYYNDHTGEKYMDFSTNPTAQKYTLPLDEIPSGSCYIVAVRFADGTSEISEVMQN